MWFDFHADIGYDLYHQHVNGNDERFGKFHLPRLQKANVKAVNVACFFGEQENWELMQECVRFVYETLKQCPEVHLVLNKEDMSHESLLVIFSVEGMCGIDEDAECRVQWLYDHGVRIASLCWNEENELATGCKGTKERGLQPLGKRVIRKMKELGMILDVSHLNDQSFFDVMKEDIPLMATHSNARSLCNVARNLTDEQLGCLKQKQAFVGANATGMFVSHELEKQDAEHFIHHVQYLMEKLGEDSVGFGFDFMDYMGSENWMLQDVKSVEGLEVLQAELLKYDTKKDIQKLGYRNGIEFLKRVL